MISCVLNADSGRQVDTLISHNVDVVGHIIRITQPPARLVLRWVTIFIRGTQRMYVLSPQADSASCPIEYRPKCADALQPGSIGMGDDSIPSVDRRLGEGKMFNLCRT